MKFLVYSVEHRGFWRQSRQGYTPLMSEAGCFTMSVAKEICDVANRFVKDGDPPESSLIAVEERPAVTLPGQLVLPNL